MSSPTLAGLTGCIPLNPPSPLLLLWCTLLGLSASSRAEESDMASYASLFPDGRHLAEFSVSSLDSAEGDQLVWLPRYTYAYSTRFRLSAGVGIVEKSGTWADGSSDSSSITDTELLLQYDPSAQLAANAFVPDTVGFSMGLRIPTASHDKGLGRDLWGLSLGAGWLVDFPWSFWLLPSLTYQFSFDEALDAAPYERADLGLGLYWLFPFKGWIGVEPVLAWDFEEDDTAEDWSLVAGKAWSSGWAVDLRWTSLDRIDPGAKRDDELLFLGISYQFGAPPRGAWP